MNFIARCPLLAIIQESGTWSAGASKAQASLDVAARPPREPMTPIETTERRKRPLKARPVVKLGALHRRPEGDAVQRFHAYANQALWKKHANTARHMANLLWRTWTWPIASAFIGARCLARFGRLARSSAGAGLVHQFFQQWALAAGHQIHPLNYYKFALYRTERTAKASTFVANYASDLLIPIANQYRPEWQKLWFTDACQRHGLPHIPILAVFADGCSTAAPADMLPKRDLFTIPSASWAGHGAKRWRYASTYEDDDGNQYSAAELAQHLAAKSRHEPLVVLPVIANHSAISRISNGALCTIRILTMLKKGATEPQYILACLRMAIGRSIVDNFAAGGIASPIDASTGRLGLAVTADPSRPGYAQHPDTGETILGSTVPMWRECVDLCIGAHKYFAPVAIVGWDVAVTPDGPVLVEGNLTCSLEMLQMSHGIGMLDTAFVDVILTYLDARNTYRA